MNSIFYHLQFWIYIVAGFLGLMGIVLAVIIDKHQPSKNETLFKSARNFITCSFLIGVMYFIDDYRILFFDEYNWLFIFRMLDILLFILQLYYWIVFITGLTGPNERIKLNLVRNTRRVMVVFGILSAVSYGFLMNDEYYVADFGVRAYVSSVQGIMCVYLAAITMVFMIKAVKGAFKNENRAFIFTVSILMMMNGLWNGIIVIVHFNGGIDLATLNERIFDPTPVMLGVINLSALLFMYKHDFSPIYFKELSDDESPDDSGGILRIDDISQEYKLTVREREIVLYVYSGYSNPEIAEELHLSKYTVRNHLHSIFEKLGVGNRVEMLHFVNSYQDGPNGHKQRSGAGYSC